MVIGVVLAGGASSRMRGVNKAEIIFEEQTLVARAVMRLSEQVSEVCLSANQNYGLENPYFTDIGNGTEGPLAGVYSALSWVSENRPSAKAILTVPVDAPFFPYDLAEKLAMPALTAFKPALAQTNDGLQPTFACWPLSVLPALDTHMKKGEAGSLRNFAKKMGARNIIFTDPQKFYNINSQEDLDKLL